MATRRTSELVIDGGRVYHLGLSQGQLAPNLFQVGDPARAWKVAKHFDTVTCEVRNREYVTVTGTYRNIPVSVIGTGIGTDNVEIALMEAYSLLFFDWSTWERRRGPESVNWIRIGTSGGVQEDVEPGTLGIAEYAVGLDGTGLFYEQPAADALVEEIERQAEQALVGATRSGSRFLGRIKPYASKGDPGICEMLVRHCQDRGQPNTSGITVSTPGFYGPSGRCFERVENVVADIKGVLSRLEIEGRRVINFEMESSLLFHLGAHLGFRTGAICVIVSKASSSTALLDYEKAVQECIEVGLDAMHEAAAGQRPGRPRPRSQDNGRNV